MLVHSTSTQVDRLRFSGNVIKQATQYAVSPLPFSPVAILLADPVPQIRVTGGNAVQILSGDRVECSIQADDGFDAEQIAGVMSFLVEVAA